MVHLDVPPRHTHTRFGDIREQAVGQELPTTLSKEEVWQKGRTALTNVHRNGADQFTRVVLQTTPQKEWCVRLGPGVPRALSNERAARCLAAGGASVQSKSIAPCFRTLHSVCVPDGFRMPYTSGRSTDAASRPQKGPRTNGRARCARVREDSFEGVPHDGLVEITGDEVHASRERWITGSHEQVDANDPAFGAVVLQVEAHHHEALSFPSLGGLRSCTRATTASSVQSFE